MKGGSSVKGDCFGVFVHLFLEEHTVFKWKYVISVFPILPGGTEALVSCGGKINQLLIA